MKRVRSNIVLVLVMALLVQLFPMNVFASEVDRGQSGKNGLMPLELEQVEITEEDLQSSFTEEEEAEIARTYGASWASYGSRYYYNLLSAQKRSLYDNMYNACMTFLTTQQDSASCTMSSGVYGRTDYFDYTGLSEDELLEVVYLFTISNPQFYFIRGTAAVGGYSGGRDYVALVLYPEYISGTSRAEATTQFSNKVNNWLKTVQAQPNDYEKAKKAHDIVCDSVVYDNYGDWSRHQSSATAVFDGITVCAGYSQLFSLLCNASGVQSICVTSLEHEWNQVYVYGAWYVVDCTWDDMDDSNGGSTWNYDYFCKSDQAISEGYHVVEDYLVPYRPACYSDFYIGRFAVYNGYSFYLESDGKVRCYDGNGNLVKNKFMFDGSYTYYMQADGSAMTDRLTYHPDGVHIIYFDSNGHEVFNAFQYCPSVGYTCYFDSQGYIYKDVITFYNDKVYYLDANGKMQNEGWFRFANGMDYGFANWDGSLNTSGFSYDPWGRIVFYHWNGMVARGLITDGAYYYSMDMTDGHYLGSFPVN